MRNTIRISIYFLFCVCLISIISNASASEPKYGGTLRIGVKVPQYNSLDDRNLKTISMVPSAALIYDALFSGGAEGAAKQIPALASSYETENNKIWIINVRKGVKFHNGRELTAEDVKQNFDWRITTPEGWKPIRWRDRLKGLKKVEVLDRYTVKFTLEEPFAPFIDILGLALTAIVPPEEVYKWKEKFTFHPVGTGPYKIKEIKPKEKIVLERFDDYWGPRSYIDFVEFKYFRSSDAVLI